MYIMSSKVLYTLYHTCRFCGLVRPHQRGLGTGRYGPSRATKLHLAEVATLLLAFEHEILVPGGNCGCTYTSISLYKYRNKETIPNKIKEPLYRLDIYIHIYTYMKSSLALSLSLSIYIYTHTHMYSYLRRFVEFFLYFHIYVDLLSSFSIY